MLPGGLPDPAMGGLPSPGAYPSGPVPALPVATLPGVSLPGLGLLNLASAPAAGPPQRRLFERGKSERGSGGDEEAGADFGLGGLALGGRELPLPAEQRARVGQPHLHSQLGPHSQLQPSAVELALQQPMLVQTQHEAQLKLLQLQQKQKQLQGQLHGLQPSGQQPGAGHLTQVQGPAALFGYPPSLYYTPTTPVLVCTLLPVTSLPLPLSNGVLVI